MFVRTETRAAFIEALQSVATDVQVVDGWDAKDLEDERIEVSDPVNGGTERYVVFSADARPRDDMFTLDCLIFAGKSGQTPAEAKERAQDLMRMVDEALRDATFDSFTFTSSAFHAVLYDALVGSDANGPFSEPGDTGARGFGNVTVDIHTRSTYT